MILHRATTWTLAISLFSMKLIVFKKFKRVLPISESDSTAANPHHFAADLTTYYAPIQVSGLTDL